VTTLILCSTGQASHEGRSGLTSLLSSVRREMPQLDVVDAFIDTQQPNLLDVIRDGSGARIVVPLTLTTDERLTALLKNAGELAGPVSVTDTLGPDWALAELGVQRLIEAGARPGDEIVMAAGNMRTRAAVDDLGRAARLLSAVWGGRVHVGTLEGLGTPIAEAIDIARAYNKRVIVSMYVLTMSAAAGAIGRLGADIVTAPLLMGAPGEPALVQLVLDRLNTPQAWHLLDSDPRTA
jgi:hypothetical protein